MVAQLAALHDRALRRRAGPGGARASSARGSAGGPSGAAPPASCPVAGWAVPGRPRLRRHPAPGRGRPGAAGGRPRPRRGRRGSTRSSRRSSACSAGCPAARDAPPRRETPLSKQILVSVDRAETRVAIMEDGRAAEVYIERRGQRSVVGHVWKGRVENVLAGMEAAFIEVGLEKNGFLHVDEVVGPRRPQAQAPDRRPPQARRRGAGAGHQGPHGHQGRPPDDAALAGGPLRGLRALRRRRRRQQAPGRRRAHAPALDLRRAAARDRRPDRPHGRGGRLGGARSRATWPTSSASGRPCRSAATAATAPQLLYSEADVSLRVIRDLLNADVDEVLVDDEAQFERIIGFLRRTSPGDGRPRAPLHRRRRPLFSAHGRRGDHPLDHGPARAAALRRLPGDRRHRGHDGHRRQQRPQRRQGRQPPRGHDHQDQPRGRHRGRPPAAPARHRRHRDHRLHRHGRREQPARGQGRPRRGPRARPHPHLRRRHLPARAGGDDAPEHLRRPARDHDRGLPDLRRRRGRAERRDAGDHGRARAARVAAAAAGRRARWP